MATTYGRNRMATRPYGRTTAYDTDEVTTRANMPFLRRISWGSVFAGVAVAMVTQMALNALGLAIGAASIEPQLGATPTAPEFGAGVVIWMAASILLSLFLGGFVAGRMSGTVSHTEAGIHGVTTWAVVVLISAFIVTSGIGTILGGVANVLGSGLNMAADGAAALAPGVGQAIESQDIELQSVTEEVRQMFASTTATTTDTTGGETPANVNLMDGASAAERRVMFSLTRLVADPTDENRQAAINAMTANGMSEDQARSQIEAWETRLAEFRTRTEQQIEQAASDFANTVARIAGVLFAAMVVGAAAAGGGALVGAPDAKYVVHKMDEVAEDVAEAQVEIRTEERDT
jgi:hypothetical protein